VYDVKIYFYCFFYSSRRRHTRFSRDWSSDVCSSDLLDGDGQRGRAEGGRARGQGVLPGDQLGDDVAALAAAAGGGDDLAVDVGEDRKSVVREKAEISVGEEVGKRIDQ